jgi:hypothetical protein
VKSKRRNMTLGMLIMAAGAASLAACATEVDADKEVQSEQSVLTADEQTPDPSIASPDSSANEVTPRVSCRRVTASSIPVFTAPNSNTVLCRFFAGDKFSYFNVVQASGFPARLTTWCPRGVPPAQGTTGYAQISGTVDGGCG